MSTGKTQEVKEELQKLFPGEDISHKINEWAILYNRNEKFASNLLNKWRQEPEKREAERQQELEKQAIERQRLEAERQRLEAERRILKAVHQQELEKQAIERQRLEAERLRKLEEIRQLFPSDWESRFEDWLKLYDRGLYEQAEKMLQRWKKSAHSTTSGLESTLIDKFEEDYKKSLYAIDNDIRKAVESGHDMKAIVLFSDNLHNIHKVHEILSSFFTLIYSNISILEKFGSKRLKQLGHKPVMLYDQVKRLKVEEGSDERWEKVVIDELNKVGFQRSHWIINPRILMEIEYLIDTLRILIEPEFIPLETEEQKDDVQSGQDRHVPSNVKIAVWRRDEGKCVKCGSQEKLEYDHIIPVSKGGSNTDRNVQLLCEKCNRQKSANIE